MCGANLADCACDRPHSDVVYRQQPRCETATAATGLVTRLHATAMERFVFGELVAFI